LLFFHLVKEHGWTRGEKHGVVSHFVLTYFSPNDLFPNDQ
jgi:hypothetical protein